MAGADFEAFYRANYARLVGQMVPVVGDVHEAEDVQEAFARASLHWSRCAATTPLTPGCAGWR